MSATDGTIYRVDGYATAPVLSSVGVQSNPQLGLAVQPGTGTFYTCGSSGFFGNFVYALDSAFGIQSTIATDVIFPSALEFDASGRLFAASLVSSSIDIIDLATGQGTSYTSNFDAAFGMAVHPDGSLYMLLIGNRLIRFDPATGTSTTTILTGITGGQVIDIEIDCDGTAYVVGNDNAFYALDLATLGVTSLGNLGIPFGSITFKLPADGPGAVGTNYCGPAVPNATGLPGAIRAFGTDAVADNDVTLVAESLPANQMGLFVTSRAQGVQMNLGGGLGTLCLGGSIARYNGSLGSSGAGGSLSFSLDLPNTPMGLGTVAVMAGETWHYQCWFRDLDAGVPSSNLTDGLSVTYR